MRSELRDHSAAAAAAPRPRVTVSAQFLAPGYGGIARAARLSLKALAEFADTDALSVEDRETVRVDMVRARHFSGRRLPFVVFNATRILNGRHVLYDFPGTARAHLPLLRHAWPYSLWIHGTEVWGRPHKVRGDYAAAVHGASLVLVNSALTLERARAALGPLPSAHLCWLGTEDDAPPPSASIGSGPPTVLIIARIEGLARLKGHAELVDAWPNVIASVPDARLVIIGGGSALDDLRRYVAASPSRTSIDIAGFVREDGIERLWRRADVFAMPSRVEGFGLVYVEAMRHGLPIIASVHDAGREVNLDGVTGFNVDLGNDGELADRLITLLVDADVRRKMGSAAFARWQEHFCFSAFKRRFIPLVEQFLN